MDQIFCVLFAEGSHIWNIRLPLYFSHKEASLHLHRQSHISRGRMDHLSSFGAWYKLTQNSHRCKLKIPPREDILMELVTAAEQIF